LILLDKPSEHHLHNIILEQQHKISLSIIIKLTLLLSRYKGISTFSLLQVMQFYYTVFHLILSLILTSEITPISLLSNYNYYYLQLFEYLPD
jgi:hypothetical protein